MSFAFIGFGVLIGESAAGAILGSDVDKNWTGMIIWCGVLLMISSAILTCARNATKGQRNQVLRQSLNSTHNEIGESKKAEGDKMSYW
jgi:hypothetical protein